MFYPQEAALDDNVLLYLVTEIQPGNQHFRPGVGPPRIKIKRFNVTNLLNAQEETEYEYAGSLVVDNPRRDTACIFNKAGPEVAISSVWALPGADPNTEPTSTRSLSFYDRELNLRHQLDRPLIEFRFRPEQFQWVGKGRCCFAVQTQGHRYGTWDRPEITYRVLDLKSKVIREVLFDESDYSDYFSNTGLSMIFSSEKWILFSSSLKKDYSFVNFSEKVKVVDLRLLSP